MVNNVVLMGRLCGDPELKKTTSDVSVTTIRLAVERPTSDKKTDFIDVVAWRQNAEFISRFFRKGSLIAVVGSLQTRSYEDKNGNKRTATEVIADRVSFCAREEQKDATSEQKVATTEISDDEELPF